MKNLDRLYTILNECAVQVRKGEVIHGTPEIVEAIKSGAEELPRGVVSFDMMPSANELKPGLVIIDLHFISIGVDKTKAESHRDELIDILDSYPRLKDGPSYLEVGAEIGDQGAAFMLFAVGEVLGFWEVVTPARLRMPQDMADQMAGLGFIMINSYRSGK